MTQKTRKKLVNILGYAVCGVMFLGGIAAVVLIIRAFARVVLEIE